MKFWVSAYNKKIYKINLSKNGKMQEIGNIELTAYPSYMYNYKNEIAVALKKENNDKAKAGVLVLDKNLKIKYKHQNNISYTHIYMNHKYLLAASYHQGEILIINKKENNFHNKIIENSRIHNVGQLERNKYYAVDLQNQRIYIFKIKYGQYKQIGQINIEHNKPRHLVCKGKYIYILCEDTAKILIYKMKKDGYIKVQEIGTVNNSIINEAAAIKVIDNIIFTTNRGDNTINVYKICKKGNLRKLFNFECYGKNPRDILIVNKKKLLIANKDSNELVHICINLKNKTSREINTININNPVCIMR